MWTAINSCHSSLRAELRSWRIGGIECHNTRACSTIKMLCGRHTLRLNFSRVLLEIDFIPVPTMTRYMHSCHTTSLIGYIAFYSGTSHRSLFQSVCKRLVFQKNSLQSVARWMQKHRFKMKIRGCDRWRTL